MKNILMVVMALMISVLAIGCSKDEPNEVTDQQEQQKVNYEEEIVFTELEDEVLIQEARNVVENLASGVTARDLEECNKIMNDVFVDVEFYSNPDEMDSDVKEVKTKFSNEEIHKSISNFYYTVDLIFEFVMKDGTTKIGEESPNTVFDFTNHDGKLKILSIQ